LPKKSYNKNNMSSINDLLQNTKDIDEEIKVSSDPGEEQKKPPTTGGKLEVQKKDQEQSRFAGEADLKAKIKEIGDKEHEEGLRIKAAGLGLGFINLKGIPIPAEVLKLLPEDVVKKQKIVCFYYAPHKNVKLAVSEEVLDGLEQKKESLPEKFPQVEKQWFLTSKESFAEAERQYETLPKIKEAEKGVEITAEDFEKMSEQLTSLKDLPEKIKNVSTTELLTLIVAAGIKTEASDIHIEAESEGIKLRYRIDGVLHTAAILEKEIWHKIISRIKLVAKLKLNISSKPQDGRFSIFLKDEKVDVRASTLPTAYGESVVMRLLRSKAVKLRFDSLGLTDDNLRLLTRQMKRPNGMIITTGPTGSGKTTTLYAVLNELNKPENKIITIEDPIEYELEGINQSQVDSGRDYTFAKGLRSIVRQDPDIVMVGEMRDLETVDIALNAALTGHLVLSTLHTNDAAGAIPRFLAMGAKPYLLAPALNLIMAQRLVRKLCPKCKKEIKLEGEIKEKVRAIIDKGQIKINIDEMKFFVPGKCEACNFLGYKGRIGIFEMFEMVPQVEQIVLSNEVSEYKIKDIAVKNGMVTMVQDGLLKASQGMTSVEEVFRVTE